MERKDGKRKNRQYKQFAMSSLEDGFLVLKSLIIPIIIDLEKLKRYTKETENLSVYGGTVSVDVYDPIHDKVL